jgi:hypothetical protein
MPLNTGLWLELADVMLDIAREDKEFRDWLLIKLKERKLRHQKTEDQSAFQSI